MANISGLELIKDFITLEEEAKLIKTINEAEWNNTLKRRTQHYGYEYNYNNNDVKPVSNPIPDWCGVIQERMIEKGYITKPFEQLIVNEYTPGQGISKHTDAKSFGNTIVSLSLGSHCAMTFKRGSESIELPLLRRSLLIMRGDARWKWTHEIPARKKDPPNNQRSTRISLTFRYLAKNDPV